MSQVAEPILMAAAKLVERHGARGLTMARLVKATGLSRASLYRQSGGLEAVLDALNIGERSQTRGKILAAAREVFGRVGFDASTVEEIALEAGVAPATVYRHFTDKDGLVTAFVEELAPKKVAREMKASGDLRADLERLARTMLEGMRDDAPLVRLLIMETLRGSRLLPRVRAMAPTRVGAAVATLLRGSKELRSDIDPTMLAQSFGGMVLAFGVIAPILRSEPSRDPEETARTIVSTFLDGALRRRP